MWLESRKGKREWCGTGYPRKSQTCDPHVFSSSLSSTSRYFCMLLHHGRRSAIHSFLFETQYFSPSQAPPAVHTATGFFMTLVNLANLMRKNDLWFEYASPNYWWWALEFLPIWIKSGIRKLWPMTRMQPASKRYQSRLVYILVRAAVLPQVCRPGKLQWIT